MSVSDTIFGAYGRWAATTVVLTAMFYPILHVGFDAVYGVRDFTPASIWDIAKTTLPVFLPAMLVSLWVIGLLGAAKSWNKSS